MRNISENILQNKYLILKSVEENECYQNAFCSQQLRNEQNSCSIIYYIILYKIS